MKLSPAQFAAAERGGCRFSPASSAEVQRLSMQSRIFWYEGQPFTARSATGFQETAGTLAKLIARHEQPIETAEVTLLDLVPVAPPVPPVEVVATEALASSVTAAEPLHHEVLPPALAEESAASPDQPRPTPASTVPDQPAVRTRQRRKPASQRSRNSAAVPTDTAPAEVGSTTRDLLQAGGRRAFPLAISIAAAQTAGTQIAGEDFVLLVERVHRTLMAL